MHLRWNAYHVHLESILSLELSESMTARHRIHVLPTIIMFSTRNVHKVPEKGCSIGMNPRSALMKLELPFRLQNAMSYEKTAILVLSTVMKVVHHVLVGLSQPPINASHAKLVPMHLNKCYMMYGHLFPLVSKIVERL